MHLFEVPALRISSMCCRNPKEEWFMPFKGLDTYSSGVSYDVYVEDVVARAKARLFEIEDSASWELDVSGLETA